MGRLAWDDVAEIRCDWVSGVAGGNGSTAEGGFWFLGIVPREETVIQRGRRQFSWQLSEYAMDVLNRIARPLRLMAPSDLPPFGVADYEIGRALDDAIDLISRYHPVVDGREATRRRAARG